MSGAGLLPFMAEVALISDAMLPFMEAVLSFLLLIWAMLRCFGAMLLQMKGLQLFMNVMLPFMGAIPTRLWGPAQGRQRAWRRR